MTVLERVKQLGALRDALLVFSSIVYLLGYATWSIYAWRSHLGPFSALDAQYFAAGFPIALGLLCTLGSAIALRRFADGRWRRFVEKRNRSWRNPVLWILLASMAILVAAAVVLLVGDKYPSPARVAAMFALVLSAYVLMPLVDAVRTSRMEPQRFERAAPTVVMTLAGGIAVAYFAWALYPLMPASFGGGRPRPVFLDIQTSSIAPETLRMLVPPGASISAGTVVRTREIDLIAAPGQYYVVGISAVAEGALPVRVQLERSSVVAVTWNR